MSVPQEIEHPDEPHPSTEDPHSRAPTVIGAVTVFCRVADLFGAMEEQEVRFDELDRVSRLARALILARQSLGGQTEKRFAAGLE